MVSLSSAGGGVGPHVDQYDVFLIQAKGRRRWSWGGPVHRTAEDVALRQVSRFEPTDHAELGPGDVLYLPPGVPHDGVALEDGAITVSIGFRAPGLTDLLGYLADTVSEHWDDAVETEPRFGDAGRLVSADPWEITRADLTGMKRLLLDALENNEMTARAFGEQVSLPRFPPEPPDVAPEPEALTKLLRSGWTLERWAGSRLFHHTVSAEKAWLFVDGFSLSVSPEFGAWITRQESLTGADWLAWHKTPDALLAIMMMVGRGTFGLVPPDKD
jgi:50S ribosomal protein L16 3-hydroxylase